MTKSYDVFEYSYNRLDALYMQSFEEQNDYRDEMKDLLTELIVIQLIASIEAYKMDLTREILTNHLSLLASPKSTKKRIVELLVEPDQTADWNAIFEEILDVGVSIKGDIAIDVWIKWLQNGIVPSLDVPQDDTLTLIEITSTRNLLIHHRGIIESRYINRTKPYYDANPTLPPPVMVTKRKVDPTYCRNAMKCINRIVSKIDKEVLPVL